MQAAKLTELSVLASHLVRVGLMEHSKACHAVQQAEILKMPLVSYLVQHNILTSTVILQSCAATFGLPIFDVNHEKTIIPDSLKFNQQLICHYHAFPLKIDNGELLIGIADPSNQSALQAIAFQTGWRVRPMLIAEDQLSKLIQDYCDTDVLRKQLLITMQKQQPSTEFHDLMLPSANEDEPLIKLVDTLLHDAAKQTASDIHLEPNKNNYRLRYRQDGILFVITEIPTDLALRIITRLKVLAKLDISERRLPQDGRFQFQPNEPASVDIRISTCPTLFGEKVVLRLLDIKQLTLDISKLGMSEEQQQLFLQCLAQAHGLILVTGPTGSGKTATLYSALHYLNTVEKNISTVEDPVEIQLPGINQVNIHTKIGLNFSTILRTLLRQDPDVIMIGEIRDIETAEIAIHAAQTGHLVLSTLHTNSAQETLTRLQAMGIATYNLTHTLILIIAQRLARKSCQYCQAMNKECHQCRGGYHGRIGIFELLPMTASLAKKLLQQQGPVSIPGFKTLWDMALEKVQHGMTTLTEIHRVIKQ